MEPSFLHGQITAHLKRVGSLRDASGSAGGPVMACSSIHRSAYRDRLTLVGTGRKARVRPATDWDRRKAGLAPA